MDTDFQEADRVWTLICHGCVGHRPIDFARLAAAPWHGPVRGNADLRRVGFPAGYDGRLRFSGGNSWNGFLLCPVLATNNT